MKYFLKEAAFANANLLLTLPVLALGAITLGFAWTYGAELASYHASQAVWRPAYEVVEPLIPNPGLPQSQLPAPKKGKA